MNDTPVKVGEIYKARPDYDAPFRRFDHNEKYVMVLSEDYSGMHPYFNVLIYYRKGPKKTEIIRWNFQDFDRWELIQ